MLRRSLNSGCDPKHFILRNAVGHRHVHNPVLAQCQRSGLVENDGVEQARLFEAAAVADEQTVTCTERRRDGDDQRHRQSQCVRTSDHKHRHHADDREVKIRAGQLPTDQRQHARQ